MVQDERLGLSPSCGGTVRLSHVVLPYHMVQWYGMVSGTVGLSHGVLPYHIVQGYGMDTWDWAPLSGTVGLSHEVLPYHMVQWYGMDTWDWATYTLNTTKLLCTLRPIQRMNLHLIMLFNYHISWSQDQTHCISIIGCIYLNYITYVKLESIKSQKITSKMNSLTQN